jgi:hypothetical protein
MLSQNHTGTIKCGDAYFQKGYSPVYKHDAASPFGYGFCCIAYWYRFKKGGKLKGIVSRDFVVCFWYRYQAIDLKFLHMQIVAFFP